MDIQNELSRLFSTSHSRKTHPWANSRRVDYDTHPTYWGNPNDHPIPLLIRPHPKAPLINNADPATIKQTIVAATGRLDHLTPDEVDLIRQLCLTNLWFLMTVVLAYNGPFNLINDSLHRDMSNFRQSDYWMKPGARAAALIPRSHYKDLATTTPVLTANRGWTTHGDLVVGDYVFAPSGKPVKVIGKSETFTDNELYKITFNDGATVVAGKDHLWRILDRKERNRIGNKRTVVWQPRILTTKELKLEMNVGVLEAPLEYPEVNLPLDPYVLGVWLGDGTSSSAHLTLHDDDKEIRDECTRRGWEIFPTNVYQKWKIGEDFRGHRYKKDNPKGFMQILRSIGVLNNKHIPDQYMTASPAQRWDLLRGLMDTDGGSARTTALFAQKDEKLADQVYDLAASLCLRPRKRRIQSYYKGEPYTSYTISFQHYEDRQPFYLSRKANKANTYYKKRNQRRIKKIERVETVDTNCIKVEGELYLFGKELIPTHNTSIFSIGGTIFDVLRDPDIRILIVNAIADRAESFLQAIEQPFLTNEFFQALFPDYIPRENKRLFKNTEMTLPNRTRSYKEPTITALGLTAAGEGIHVDAMIIDDPVGMDDISNTRSSNENMRRARNWFNTSEALLVSRARSRVGYIGTRYAADDVAELIVENAAAFHGHQDPDFRPRKDGRWHVYYRLCVEDGKPILPSDWSLADFEAMAKADWWNFVTQYLNKPQASGLTEFSDYELREASIDWPTGKDPQIHYPDRTYVSLADCDVVLTCDPAGTESDLKAKTSRTSIGLWALDAHGRYTRIWGRVGYYDVHYLLDSLFKAHEIFGPYIRATVIETNAMQKILLPIIRKEEVERNLSIRPRGIPARGDKKARIRAALTMPLMQGRVYAVPGESTYMAFYEEMRLFPSSDSKLDCLDESEKAFTFLIQPATDAQKEASWEEFQSEQALANVIPGTVGY